jgi:hypothetical protein
MPPEFQNRPPLRTKGEIEMPKPVPNQSVASQPAAPHPNQPHQVNLSSPAMVKLAQAVVRAHEYLSNPKVHRSAAPDDQPRSRPSTVSQAKNYLRAGKAPAPGFLRSAVSPERHRRKCAICSHPEREMIEDLFIHWHSPRAIANFLRDYDRVNWVSIYRHAYALGLDAIRRRNLNHFFENTLDDATQATPTLGGILGAARALSCLTEDGRWIEPPKRVIVTTIVRKEDPHATTSTDPDSHRSSAPQHDGSTQLFSSHELDPALIASSLPEAEIDPRGTGSQPVRVNPAGSPESNSRVAAHGALATKHDQWNAPSSPRSGHPEIRHNRNSHKTKDNSISNR